jgi:hypothetical protein
MQNGVLQPATSQQVKFYVFLVSTGAKLLLWPVVTWLNMWNLVFDETTTMLFRQKGHVG